MEDYFDRAPELEERLLRSGKEALYRQIIAVTQMVNIQYVRQQEAKGLGHAVLCAKSFVGSEPFCPVTSAYNRAMARKLPEKGIELVELPRLEQGDPAISATAVRKLIRAGRWEDIRPLVPEATFAYFSAPENRQRFLKRDV